MRHLLAGDSPALVASPPELPTLNPKVQLTHFGQDISFTETAVGLASIAVSGPDSKASGGTITATRSAGSGYQTAPAVTIAGPASGVGRHATAAAEIADGVITSITVSNIGTFSPTTPGPYSTTAPVVTIHDSHASPGSGAVIALHTANGYIDYVSSFTGGSGYHAGTTTITVSGARSPQGALDPSLDAVITIAPNGVVDGAVSNVTVTDGGSGYAVGETVQVSVAAPAGGGTPAVLGANGSETAAAYQAPSQRKFQAWAADVIQFVANTGVSTTFINIGDYKADTKGVYSYLDPALGRDAGGQPNGIPWIVTDFLDVLAVRAPHAEVGAIAYLKDAWHLYDEPGNPNFEGNLLITDGQPARVVGGQTVYSPPKNNMYQALQLVNEINSFATTRFITHFEFDGEGGGAFVQDDPPKTAPSYYGFNTSAADHVIEPPNPRWAYTPAPAPAPGQEPRPGTSDGWPTTGPGYTKWLWNRLMPGVTEDALAPGGRLPGSATGRAAVSPIPNVVYTDAQAVDPTTWSANPDARAYQFGSISYSQPAWFPSSRGPVQSYAENYWYGENNYMPGDSSAVWQDPNGPTVLQPTDTTVYASEPTVTFNTPTNGNPAAGYAVLSTGGLTITAEQIGNFFGDNGLGGGFSTGVWVTTLPTQPGYANGDTITFPNDATNGGTRPATGSLIVDHTTGLLTGVVVTDPGAGWTDAPTSYLINGQPDPHTGAAKATFQALLRPEDGYPVVTFPTPTGSGARPATGYLTVTPQGYRPGAVNGITILDPGAGYTQSDITALGSPGAHPIVISQSSTLSPAFTTIRAQYATAPNSGSTSLLPAGVALGNGQHGFYGPVPKGAGMIDQIVVTRFGDHYTATGPDSPAYVINNTGPATPVPLNTTTYNKQYAPIFTREGGFIIDGNGLSLVSVVDGGSGYSAGAVLTTPSGHGATYDLPPTVVFTNAVGDTTGAGAEAVVTLDSANKIAGIQITDPGSGYTAEPTISFQRAAGDTQTGPITDTAVAWIRNFPRVTITSGTQSPTRPARAYAVVTPTDSSAQNYDTGYLVKSIQFADTGAGYVPPATGTDLPVVAIDMLPTMTVAPPPAATSPAGTQARVDGQLAIVTKWNAFWVDDRNSITGELGPVSEAPRESVGGVSVAAAGAGYGSDVTVVFSAPPAGGETAVGFAVLDPDGGGVARIAITDPGSGYTAPPTATIHSPSGTGSGASLTVDPLVPRIRGGGNVYNYAIWDGRRGDTVTNITVVTSDDGRVSGAAPQSGSGYQRGDRLVFSGGTPLPGMTIVPPEAVVAAVDPSGGVLSFTITSGGGGYATAPAVTIARSVTVPGAVDAELQASLDNSILSVNAADAVYAHYKDWPQSLAQMFNDPKYTAENSLKKLDDRSYQRLNLQQDNQQVLQLPGKGIGNGAIATFSLESVLFSNTGSEAVHLGAGGGATARATVTGGAITAVAVTAPGGNYLVPPLVQITDPHGRGAEATAVLAADGTVSGITVTAAGSGYSSSPTVTLLSQGACLDAKYHDPTELLQINALGGTFGGLSALSYEDFITFLNTAADIVVGSQKASGVNLAPADYVLSGGVTLTSQFPDFQNIRQGMTVEGVGVPAGTTVATNPTTTNGTTFTVTLSQAITPGDAPPSLVVYDPISAGDVTFSIYDAAFLPLSWLSGQVANNGNPANQAPVHQGGALGSVEEHADASTVVYTARAIDPDFHAPNNTVTYSLKPGVGDAAMLAIDAQTGQVRLRTPANYEAKSRYDFTVVATDGATPALSSEQVVRVNVRDVFEVPVAPTIVVPAAFGIVEDTTTPLVFSEPPLADADSAPAKRLTLTLSVPEGAILAARGPGVTIGGTPQARTLRGSLTALNAYLTSARQPLAYRPAADATQDQTLTIRVRESYRGFRLVATAASGLQLTAVNDPPRVQVPAAFRGVEDTASSLRWPRGLTPVTDVDSETLVLTLAVSAGVIDANDGAGVTVGGTATARTLSGAPADLNRFLRQPAAVTYTPPSDSTATQPLTITVDDGDLRDEVTSRILIGAVNDAPALEASGLVLGAVAGAPFRIDAEALRVATGARDVDSRRLTFIVDTVTSGTVQRRRGTRWVTISPRSPLSARLVTPRQPLRWIAPAGALGTTPAFTVRGWDGRSASATASQIEVSIAAPADTSFAYFIGETSEVDDVPAGYGVIGEFDATDRATITGGGRIVGESVALKNQEKNNTVGYSLWPLIKDLFSSPTPVAPEDRAALAENILAQVLVNPGLSPESEFPSPDEGTPTAPGAGYVIWAQDFEFTPGVVPTMDVYAGVTAVLWAGRTYLGDAMKIYPVPSSSLFKTLGDITGHDKGDYVLDQIINGAESDPYLTSLGLQGLPPNPQEGSNGEWNFLSFLYANGLIDGFFGQNYNATQVGIVTPDTLPFYDAGLPYAIQSAHDDPSQVATGGPWNTVYNGDVPFHATVYWAGDVDPAWGQPPKQPVLRPTQAPLPTRMFAAYGR